MSIAQSNWDKERAFVTGQRGVTGNTREWEFQKGCSEGHFAEERSASAGYGLVFSYADPTI